MCPNSLQAVPNALHTQCCATSTLRPRALHRTVRAAVCPLGSVLGRPLWCPLHASKLVRSMRAQSAARLQVPLTHEPAHVAQFHPVAGLRQRSCPHNSRNVSQVPARKYHPCGRKRVTNLCGLKIFSLGPALDLQCGIPNQQAQAADTHKGPMIAVSASRSSAPAATHARLISVAHIYGSHAAMLTFVLERARPERNGDASAILPVSAPTEGRVGETGRLGEAPCIGHRIGVRWKNRQQRRMLLVSSPVD